MTKGVLAAATLSASALLLAAATRADSIGNQAPVAMDDLVEVGVFAGKASGDSPGESLYLQQHRIHAGKHAIVITVPRQPARAGIDPRRQLIERVRDDNVGEIGSLRPK